MSDEITLRATPGRDSTAAEIARNRGEFRRQPHLVVTTQSVPTEPIAPLIAEPEAKPAAPEKPKPAAKTAEADKPRPSSATGEFGRSRLTH
jgi:outer membrane biosynthesis protein TonB